MIYTSTMETPLGEMTAAAENEALTGLWFNGQRYFPTRSGEWTVEHGHPVFLALRLELERYFSGVRLSGELPLAPQGSPFQMAVWEVLAGIPYGETVTYGYIGQVIAAARGLSSMSSQAIGGAVGHNPISILIPCHRVLGFGGKLTGYAGGLERKQALLRLEGVQLSGDADEILPLQPAPLPCHQPELLPRPA